MSRILQSHSVAFPSSIMSALIPAIIEWFCQFIVCLSAGLDIKMAPVNAPFSTFPLILLLFFCLKVQTRALLSRLVCLLVYFSSLVHRYPAFTQGRFHLCVWHASQCFGWTSHYNPNLLSDSSQLQYPYESMSVQRLSDPEETNGHCNGYCDVGAASVCRHAAPLKAI